MMKMMDGVQINMLVGRMVGCAGQCSDLQAFQEYVTGITRTPVVEIQHRSCASSVASLYCAFLVIILSTIQLGKGFRLIGDREICGMPITK